MDRVPQHRRGIALVWVAIFFIVFIGVIGLAMDKAWLGLVHHQLQNSADAASLAGVRYVRADKNQARDAARTIAQLNRAGTDGAGTASPVQLDLNTANAGNGDIVVGIFNRNTGVFNPLAVDSTALPNALRVNARRTEDSLGGTQPLIFGSAFERDSASASRTATALIAGGVGAGLLVLDPRGNGPGDSALLVQGNPYLTVLGGTIHVNSASNRAVSMGGSFGITAEEMNIVGSMQDPPTHFTVNTGMPVLPDPLTWLQPPSTAGLSQQPQIQHTNGSPDLTLNPGWYANGIKITGGNVTFRPGTYIIGNPQNPTNNTMFEFTGGNITALSCTFYIASGGIKWTGGGTYHITAPPLDQGHYYEHITIFQNRTNVNNDPQITGSPGSILEGTLYFPGRLNGTGGPSLDINGSFGGNGIQIITYRIRIGGSSNLRLDFDGWWPGPLTSRVYLVE